MISKQIELLLSDEQHSFYQSSQQQDVHETLLKSFHVLHKIREIDLSPELVLSEHYFKYASVNIIKNNFSGSLNSTSYACIPYRTVITTISNFCELEVDLPITRNIETGVQTLNHLIY